MNELSVSSRLDNQNWSTALNRFVILALFLVTCTPVSQALARGPTCITRVPSEYTGEIRDWRETPSGLLLAAQYGIFLYDGVRVSRIEGSPTGAIRSWREVPGGLLLKTDDELFYYDGARVTHVAGGIEGNDLFAVRDWLNTPSGLLLETNRGLYRYDQTNISRVDDNLSDDIHGFLDSPAGLLVSSREGVFLYRDKKLDRVGGQNPEFLTGWRAIPGGLLLSTFDDLFRFDGARISKVEGVPPKYVSDWLDTRGELLLSGRGLFRFDGSRVLKVYGDLGDGLEDLIKIWHEVTGGVLLGTDSGLFLYNGARTSRVDGEVTGRVNKFQEVQGDLLVGANNGLFRYHGEHVSRVQGGLSDAVTAFVEAPRELLVGTVGGLYRYEDGSISRVGGDQPATILTSRAHAGGLLLGTTGGLFKYDGSRVFRVPGDRSLDVVDWRETQGGLLVRSGEGLFRTIDDPLSAAKIVLDNQSELIGAAPTTLGVPTRWSLSHPCAAFADQLGLQIVASDADGRDRVSKAAIGFKDSGENASFEATLPVPDSGRWSFRVVSTADGRETDVGVKSEPVAFFNAGLMQWLRNWWQTIAAMSAFFLIVINLFILTAARYSTSACRLAMDDTWGKTVLGLQGLLLRHSTIAQLWLIDLYVQHRRKAVPSKPSPFLPLPLVNPEMALVGSDVILPRLASARHLWIQGGPGMGKTTIFNNIVQRHFRGTDLTSFAAYRRDGCVLVPIEARRFPEQVFDDNSPSGWVTACVRAVLSEAGMPSLERSLLRAMFDKGILAVGIDGLNEVARYPAVIAFASEFPAAPMFVTSQESGEPPFEVWHLPSTIVDYIDGLLTLYMGQAKGEAVAHQLRQSGLFDHLRSGYDVRLVVQLMEAEPTGRNLPRDRLELYRAVVAAAWPDGDKRLEVLQAAAWNLISERGPNEDKRQLKPDSDAPKDLLEAIERASMQPNRIRLLRRSATGYEFVHDQMSAYLAACWFAGRPTVAVMFDLLNATKIWQDGLEAQRTLWAFVAVQLNQYQLEALWIFAGDNDRRAVLGRALVERAEHEGWSLTRPPMIKRFSTIDPAP